MRAALDDHRKRLIYWGTIATDKILPLLSYGVEWEKIMKTTPMPNQLQDHDMNFRIYKDAASIRNYITLSIEKSKLALMEEKIK